MKKIEAAQIVGFALLAASKAHHVRSNAGSPHATPASDDNILRLLLVCAVVPTTVVWVAMVPTTVVPTTVVPTAVWVAIVTHLLVEAKPECHFPWLHLSNEHAQGHFLILCHPWAHLLHHWTLAIAGVCAHTFDLLDRTAHSAAHGPLHALRAHGHLLFLLVAWRVFTLYSFLALRRSSCVSLSTSLQSTLSKLSRSASCGSLPIAISVIVISSGFSQAFLPTQ